MAEVDILKKEWVKMAKKEDKFLSNRINAKPLFINEKLDEYIPDKLRDTLKSAYNKAFNIVFEKGGAIIEKTYDRSKYEFDYKMNEYAYGLKNDKKSINAFSDKAKKAKKLNMAVSCVSGIGLGVLGAGLPDIPLFTATVLKNIYETAMSFGFEYESEKEKLFILKIIENAMKYGVDFAEENTKFNRMIEKGGFPEGKLNEQLGLTAQAMTDEMIYMKFIQGFTFVGVVGGAYDVVILNRISDYAMLKYKRRFLVEKVRKYKMSK